MILALGWPSVFYGFGSLGIVWWAFWGSGFGNKHTVTPYTVAPYNVTPYT